jgi:osmoprotectant transport system permease protein
VGEGAANRMNIFSYLFDPAHWTGDGIILGLLGQHLAYTGVAVAIAAIVAIPLGILIGHTGRGAIMVIGLSNGVRAIPTLGLLFLAVMLLGTGAINIVVVLAILALPSILSATAAGISGADREAVHAARAIGMTEGQIVSKVEWPLALPLVISGLRSATLQVVATATVAAFTSGGGLGRLLTSGQAQSDYPQMFAGAILIAALAILLDLLLGGVGLLAGRRTRPRSKTAPSLAVAPT